jgi:parvulin-like peptidyl-prolyl isomerase
MTPPSPRLRAIALALVAGLALTACNAAEPAAATVDGERITDQQVAFDATLFQFLGALRRTPCGTPAAGETQASACARFTLSNVIQEDLVKHYAAAHDVTVDTATVTQAITQLETSLGGPDVLDGQLKAHGLTRADLTALARRLLLFNQVRTALATAQLTDATLHTIYDQQRVSLTQINVKDIRVATQAEAGKIEKQVTPANFAKLAQRFSTDTTTAANGGDLGTVAGATLDPTFANAALALRPGEISQPVQTQTGWHIIELVSATVVPFDQAKSQLIDQQSQPIFNVWLSGALSTADITVNPKYGRLDLTTGDVVPIRSTASGQSSPSPSPSAGAATPAPSPSP